MQFLRQLFHYLAFRIQVNLVGDYDFLLFRKRLAVKFQLLPYLAIIFRRVRTIRRALYPKYVR